MMKTKKSKSNDKVVTQFSEDTRAFTQRHERLPHASRRRQKLPSKKKDRQQKVPKANATDL